jgi:hypothetical protein
LLFQDKPVLNDHKQKVARLSLHAQNPVVGYFAFLLLFRGFWAKLAAWLNQKENGHPTQIRPHTA